MTYSLERVVSGRTRKFLGKRGDARGGQGGDRQIASSTCSGIDVREAVETEVVPRLLQAHGAPRSGAVPGSWSGSPLIQDPGQFREPLVCREEIESFSDLVLANPDAAGRRLRARAACDLTLDAVYLDLLAPAARRLGVLWEEDRCDFGAVTVGVGHLRRMMRDLSADFVAAGAAEIPTVTGRRRILLVPVPGEQHSFGLHMVGDYLRRAGWDVCLELPPSREDLAALVRLQPYAVVGIATGSECRLEPLAACIRAIRRSSRDRDVKVLAGGPVFVEHPEWAVDLGADGTAVDGRQAVLAAERVLTLPC